MVSNGHGRAALAALSGAGVLGITQASIVNELVIYGCSISLMHTLNVAEESARMSREIQSSLSTAVLAETCSADQWARHYGICI
jgi:hypothetical protein